MSVVQTGSIGMAFGSINASSSTIKTSAIDSSQGKDKRLERIINKFKSGRKLNASELEYLAGKSPATFQKVVRIIREREELERRMREADSKEEVMEVVAEVMGNIEKLSGEEEFEVTSRTNQYSDAVSEYVQTSEYKEKSGSKLENMEIKNQRREKSLGIDDLEEKERKKAAEKKKKSKKPSTDEGSVLYQDKENNSGVWDYKGSSFQEKYISDTFCPDDSVAASQDVSAYYTYTEKAIGVEKKSQQVMYSSGAEKAPEAGSTGKKRSSGMVINVVV